MWIRPTLPSSSCRNAPYGVMRWTAPSTTAPTSRSAIGTPFRKMGRDRTIPPPPEAVNRRVRWEEGDGHDSRKRDTPRDGLMQEQAGGTVGGGRSFPLGGGAGRAR